ncbi:MAG: fasciclin domain-containing protein [Flavisolibacter sp.]
MKKISWSIVFFAGMLCSPNIHAQGKMKIKDASMSMKEEKTVDVGGAPMYPSKNIVENAVHSKDHTTLVAAVKAAGLVETLEGKGPFTVFAPTNDAFDKLPAGTVDNLVKPENKAALTKILTYHVVPGRVDSKELMKWIQKGHGTAMLKTVEGGKLWVMQKDDGLWVKDEKGSIARVTIKDVYQSNGVIHVIDTVLMPQ